MSKSEKPKVRNSRPRSAEDFRGEYVGSAFLEARYGVSRITIWSWTKEGKLPQPVYLAHNVKRWKLSNLLAWEAAKAA